jgi:hypothetical protein
MRRHVLEEGAMLQVDRDHLAGAVTADIITPVQADRLWQFLQERAAASAMQERGPHFTFTNVLYYLGGMLAIGAMSLFMTLGWEQFGGWGIFFIALLYAGVAFKLASRFEAHGLAVPMGIMATLIVVLIPLAVWGLQNGLGLWPPAGPGSYRAYHYAIDWRWMTLEFATLVGAMLMLYRYKAPFLLMPVAVTLWYMSMDVAALLIYANEDGWSQAAWTFRKWFSIAFGAVMVLVAFWVDLRSRLTKDYAFWLYLFGLLAFWGGLSSLGSNQLSGKLVYLAINLALVLIGAVIVRRSFTVFGAIGVGVVLVDISARFFRHSLVFPIALTLIGLAIVFVGVWWSRNEARIAARLQRVLPADLRELIVARRAAV